MEETRSITTSRARWGTLVRQRQAGTRRRLMPACRSLTTRVPHLARLAVIDPVFNPPALYWMKYDKWISIYFFRWLLHIWRQCPCEEKGQVFSPRGAQPDCPAESTGRYRFARCHEDRWLVPPCGAFVIVSRDTCAGEVAWWLRRYLWRDLDWVYCAKQKEEGQHFRQSLSRRSHPHSIATLGYSSRGHSPHTERTSLLWNKEGHSQNSQTCEELGCGRIHGGAGKHDWLGGQWEVER